MLLRLGVSREEALCSILIVSLYPSRSLPLRPTSLFVLSIHPSLPLCAAVGFPAWFGRFHLAAWRSSGEASRPPGTTANTAFSAAPPSSLPLSLFLSVCSSLSLYRSLSLLEPVQKPSSPSCTISASRAIVVAALPFCRPGLGSS